MKVSLKCVPINSPINSIPALVAYQVTSHCLDKCWLIYWRIYASLGLNELKEIDNFFG